MKEIDVTLKGSTHGAKNGRYDQLLVTMSVSECINNESGDKRNFPIPELTTVSIEPYRMVVPLNEKCGLIRHGSEVEFRVTGTIEEPKVALVKVGEREPRPLSDFLAALQLKKG